MGRSTRTPEVADATLDDPFLHKIWIEICQLHTESSVSASIISPPTHTAGSQVGQLQEDGEAKLIPLQICV